MYLEMVVLQNQHSSLLVNYFYSKTLSKGWERQRGIMDWILSVLGDDKKRHTPDTQIKKVCAPQ